MSKARRLVVERRVRCSEAWSESAKRTKPLEMSMEANDTESKFLRRRWGVCEGPCVDT